MIMDDNSLKVYEAEIKGQSSSSSNSQNVAFVSSENTSSGHAYHEGERFLQEDKRNSGISMKETIGFDKTKFLMFNNFHRKMGVSGYDWTFSPEKGLLKHCALMTYTYPSSSSSDSEVDDSSIRLKVSETNTIVSKSSKEELGKA
ncbi:hypothetical protein Tco_0849927 [Tanacetum coccineum]